MRRTTALLFAAITAGALALTGAVTHPEPAEAAPGRLIFSEYFSGPAGAKPSAAKWYDYSTATYNSSAAYGELRPGDNETLDGAGHLIIPATPTAGSAIRTRFSFVYGTMSAWIKLPAEPGYWPAFWSLNNNADGVEAPLVGEVDALEAYTTWNDVYHVTTHNWTNNGSPANHSTDHRCPGMEDADLSGKFNKFSATISPGKITYTFNNRPCGKAFFKDPTTTWSFGPDNMAGNWMILNLAVGGADGQQTPATQPAQMLVDRVEVHALPTLIP